MKKLLIFAVALIGVLCFVSCEKKHSSRGGGSSSGSSEPIKTSYWSATLSSGESFYIGIEGLTKEDKDDLPSELKKCTNTLDGYIVSPEHPIYSAQLNGVAYQAKNQIIVEGYVRQNGSGDIEVPDIYEYDGNSLNCTLNNGETVQFTEITKEEYDAAEKF